MVYDQLVELPWPPQSGPLPSIREPLWVGEWRYRQLLFRIVAAEPCPDLGQNADVPLPTALAQVAAQLRPYGAVLALDAPSRAISAQRAADLVPVRILTLHDAEDLAWWDQALALGQPFYAVLGNAVRLSVRQPRVSSVLSSLAYGLFVASEGLWPQELAEDRQGVRWRFAESVATTVWVNGMVAHRENGASGAWVDTVLSGAVRLEFAAADGRRCITQPRLIAPRGPAASLGGGCA